MKKYILNMAWMLSDRVLMLLFQLTLFSSIKRVYGIDILGGWATINNLSQILISFFMLGIDIIVVKKIVESPHNAGKEIGSALAIQIFGVFLYSCVLYFIVENFYSNIENAGTYVCIFILANFFSIFAKSIYFHYIALVESKYRAISIILSIILAFMFLFYSLLFNREALFFTYAVYYIIQAFISVFVYVVYFKKKSKWKVNAYLAKDYLFIGLKLVVSTVSVSIFAQADTLMLEKLSGVAEAGAFSAALRVSTIWFFCAGIIANAFFPIIVKLKNKESNLFLIRWMISITTSITIVVSIVVSFISTYIMSFLYGDGMALSANILTIHIWSSVFIFMGAFSSKWLYAKNDINIDIYKTISAAILNVILNYFIIPSYGAVGAAYVSMLSYVFANLVFFYFVKRTRIMFWLQIEAILGGFNPAKLIREYKDVKCLFL